MGRRLPILLATLLWFTAPSASLAENPASRAALACPRLEIAAVSSGGASAVRIAPSALGPVSLQMADLASTEDVIGAFVNTTEGAPVLNLTFKREAGLRIRNFTARHVGGSIAIIVDGGVTRVVKVLDPIKGDGILIGPVDRSSATALATRLNRCAGTSRKAE